MKLSHKVSNVSNVSGVLSKTKLVNIQSNHFINDLTHSTHNTHLFTKAKAFTLAEVLITLGIIGVVAAVTMPTLITNINERRNSERQANIAQKITQAMEHMRALGKLTQYNSTEDFVNELKNHLKISKICYKDNIADCWPTETVIDKDGNEYNVADAKTGEDLNKNTTTNNVGLILADGASIILNYDNTDKGLDVGDPVIASKASLPVGGGKNKDFPYTTSVTSSIDFVMDVNGKGNPNRESNATKSYDIRSFKENGARFSVSVPWENGTAGKILYLGTQSTYLDCTDSSNETYCNYGGHNSGLSDDYWAAAIKACKEQTKGKGSLPEVSKLQEIQLNKGEYDSIKNSTNYFWSSEEDKDNDPHNNVTNVEFRYGYTMGISKRNYARQVVCAEN